MAAGDSETVKGVLRVLEEHNNGTRSVELHYDTVGRHTTKAESVDKPSL
jgi:hypothetical protein